MAKTTQSTTVKNKRLKMSPGGVITLPVSARKALNMQKGEGSQVTIAIEKNAVTIAPASKTGGYRVSPKGQLELRGEAKSLLAKGTERHFWLELNDGKTTVKLNPY